MIGVIGGGGWGSALAKVCAEKGFPVEVWARETEVVNEINFKHTNSTFLPGVILPSSITANNNLAAVVSNKKYLIMTVPSQWVRSVAREIKQHVSSDTIIISASKGIEVQSLKLMTDILTEELSTIEPNAIIALSGPTHAEEVVRDIPTVAVVSTPSLKYAEEVQELLITSSFRIYTNPDRIGVQLGGALKNVIALAAGISDGLQFGDNTKAALVTRGMAEMARLGAAMGAKTPTFAGVSGMGDLFVTAYSNHSRNSWAGREIGMGKSLSQVMNSTKMVVEGIATTQAAYKLAMRLGTEMPITFVTYQILYENIPPRDGVRQLMERVRTHEMEEVVSATYTWV